MSQFKTNESRMTEQDPLLTTAEAIRSQSNILTHPTSIFCRLCYKGSSVGKLIRPCRCMGFMEFIHFHCLETSIKDWNIFYCTFCNAPFPLEPRNKPLLEWCRNRKALLRMLRGFCGALFKMLGLLLYNVLLVVIISILIMTLDFSKLAQFISLVSVIFVLFGCLLLPIIQEMHLVHISIISLYKSCIYWKISNQEMRVIKGLPDINQRIIS